MAARPTRPPTDAPAPPAPRPFSTAAGVALGVATLLAGAAMAGGFGFRFGWWSVETGQRLVVASALGAAGGLVLASLAALQAWPQRRRGLGAALVAGALAAVTLGMPLGWYLRERHLPRIHDITTDTQDPPPFVALVPARLSWGATNPADYGGPPVAFQQLEAYPDLRPLYMDKTPQEAFGRAEAAAAALGWEIVAADPETGLIEATDRTTFFGFVDDVVVRIRPVPGADMMRARVDVRSKSRIGESDLGTNADRIRAFLDRLGAPGRLSAPGALSAN